MTYVEEGHLAEVLITKKIIPGIGIITINIHQKILKDEYKNKNNE